MGKINEIVRNVLFIDLAAVISRNMINVYDYVYYNYLVIDFLSAIIH